MLRHVFLHGYTFTEPVHDFFFLFSYFDSKRKFYFLDILFHVLYNTRVVLQILKSVI